MNIFLATDIGVLALYLVCLIYIAKKDKSYLLFFISATFYALFFENMNILISMGEEGSYYYNKNFVMIFHVPLFVILAWAIIIYTSIKMAESMRITKNSLPFAASLLVLLIDLAIDVVAIRLDFWAWIGYGFREGYFGVPANNFNGWLLVSFSLFYLDQKIKFRNQTIKYIFLPLLAYLTFLFLFIPITFIDDLLLLDKKQEFFIFAFIVAVFTLSIKIGGEPKKCEKIIYFLRLPFYLFGIYFILAKKMYEENVLLLFIAIVFLIIELFLIMGERIVSERKNSKRNF